LHIFKILHSDKDHQLLLVGDPSKRRTNSRWRTAAIFKNGEKAISRQWLERSAPKLTMWCTFTLETVSAVTNLNS